MLRRSLLCAVLAAATLPAALPALGQTWPSKPITIVVPFPPGGGTDAFARPLAAQLDQQLGQRVLIDNRGGAGGTLGAGIAAKAAPDGYTFFMGAAHHAIAPGLYPKLEYDLEKDFIPIGVLAAPPQVLVAHPEKIKARTLADFLAHVRANPGQVTYASAGNGTTHHLAGELFKLTTKTDLRHVPYRGAGPAMQDLLAGVVDVEFDGLGSSAAQIAGKRLGALAVASPKRNPAIPDVPTFAEAGIAGYEVATWYALWAPKGTPQPVIDRVTDELKKALASEPIKAAWAKNGSEIPNLWGADFGKFVTAEIARWGKVVREANVKLD